MQDKVQKISALNHESLPSLRTARFSNIKTLFVPTL